MEGGKKMQSELSALRAVTMQWQAPQVPQEIPHGDLPGDKIYIDPVHCEKAAVLVRNLALPLGTLLESRANGKAVLSISGGSGVGKSEVASVLSYYLNTLHVGCHIISGDNYPHRIPAQNDAERLRIYRAAGIQSLIRSGVYSQEVGEYLRDLFCREQDSDPASCSLYPWLKDYQRAGWQALEEYLGTPKEIDYDNINERITQFKAGKPSLWCKRMGRTDSELWYDAVDVRNCAVLIIEWTHGNSVYLKGIDLPVLLASTPQETLEHRRARARDGKVDSTFTSVVLEIEQEKIKARASAAAIILSKAGHVIDTDAYMDAMAE